MSTTLRRARRLSPQLYVSGCAAESAREALRQTPGSVLADWFGVSRSRVSHRLADGRTCVAETYALIEDPAVNGAALFAGAAESLERRYLREASEDRAACEQRLAVLLEREHDREAAQNRALQSRTGEVEACLAHASDLIEIAMRKRALAEVTH